MAVKGEAIEKIVVAAPNFQTVRFTIVGTAPLVMNRMSNKVIAEIKRGMEGSKGRQTTGRTKREPPNWEERLDGALHYSTEGWIGIPAPAFRSACITACKIIGFRMTLAKLAIFIRPDGFDRDDGTPLVRIYGDYVAAEHVVRLKTMGGSTAAVTVRPMWNEWGCNVVADFDGDMFRKEDMHNLFTRAGLQVGVLEGRPNSKASDGMGWGTFAIKEMAVIR